MIETGIFPGPHLPGSSQPQLVDRVLVAHTVYAWRASDGAVEVQIANLLSDHVAMLLGLVTGHLSPGTLIHHKTKPDTGL